MILNFGFISIPYVNKPESLAILVNSPKLTKRGKISKRFIRQLDKAKKVAALQGTEAKTTDEVADYLEEKYGVLQTFVEHNSEDIGDVIGKRLAAKIEEIVLGEEAAPLDDTKFIPDISSLFIEFIENREMDGLEGVPTQAALAEGDRPSFYDTGNYANSMVAWFSED
jgi:hypothetical protein